MKRIVSQKQWNWIKRNVRPENGIMPSLMVAFLMIAAFGHKQDIQADNGSVGRGALFGGLTGATIGGIAGGGRGAGIGAAVGLGTGALIGAASSSNGRSSDPYRRLDKLQSKRNKLENKIASTSSDRRRAKYERELEATQNQIDRMQADLGIRQQPARGDYYQQPARSRYQQSYRNGYNEYK